MTLDVLIIGGGPAGATMAFLLAEAGWSVGVVEKKNFPRRKVCGEFISATSLPLLQKLGMADFYMSHGGPEVRRVGLFVADTLLTSTMPPMHASSNKWGRSLRRDYLDTALLDRAVSVGAKLWQPYCVKSLQRNDGLFSCAAVASDKTEEISARLVIMAHGSWEREVKASSPKVHKSSDLLAFKAHFSHCDLPLDLMPLIVFPGGYGGFAHSGEGLVTLSFCIRRDILQYARQQHSGLPAAEAALRHITSTCLGARKTLTCAQREGHWLSAGPIRPGIRKLYADGIFFVGNIAGEAHPIIAEGISMAMQSAGLLSQILLAHRDEVISGSGMASVGEAYRRQWSAYFATRIRVAAVFAQLAMRPRMVALMLPLFKWFPSMLTVGAKLSGKIHKIPTSTKSTATGKESAT